MPEEMELQSPPTTDPDGLIELRQSRGRALKRAREDAGLSAQDLAQKAKEGADAPIRLNRDGIYAFEKGDTLLESPVADYLADALQIRVSQLLFPGAVTGPAPPASSEARDGFQHGIEFAMTQMVLRDAQQVVLLIRRVELELALELLMAEKSPRFRDELRDIRDRLKQLARMIRLADYIQDAVHSFEDDLASASKSIEVMIKLIEKVNSDDLHELEDKLAEFRRELLDIADRFEATIRSCDEAAKKFECYRECLNDTSQIDWDAPSRRERVVHMLESLTQLERATTQFEAECCKPEGQWDCRRLGTLAWKICDLTQLLNLHTPKLYPEQEEPVRQALQYMMNWVANAKKVLEEKNTNFEKVDVVRLQIACSHVQQRIPSFRECIELDTSNLDRISRRRPR